MSRDDEVDEAPRRRNRWGEDEEEAPARYAREPSSRRSGVVTTAGVFTMILGVLVLLAGVCGGAGMLIAGSAEFGRGQMMPGAQGILLVALLACLVIVLWGA